MALADDRDVERPVDDADLVFEDVSTGLHASGFGTLQDGRSFAFGVIERTQLVVELYRPRLAGPVPQAEDVVATAIRSCKDIDLTDERSLTAAVRDAIATAEPGPRLPTIG